MFESSNQPNGRRRAAGGVCHGRRAALGAIMGAAALALPGAALAYAGEAAPRVGADDRELIALAKQFVASSRLVDELSRVLWDLEDAVEYPEQPPAMLRRPEDRRLFDSPDKVGVAYLDDRWLKGAAANVARIRDGGLIAHEFARAYCARVEEVVAALTAWQASCAAADEASGAPALRADLLAAEAERNALESRLAAAQAASLAGVFAKFAAVAEAIGGRATEEDPEEIDEIEFHYPRLLLSALQDYARLAEFAPRSEGIADGARAAAAISAVGGDSRSRDL
jgi:hypothetical protein